MGLKIVPRKEIQWFSIKMEEKLCTHDRKGGWEDCSINYLAERILEEFKELLEAVEKGDGIIEEAADIANFAMMIATRCKIDHD